MGDFSWGLCLGDFGRVTLAGRLFRTTLLGRLNLVDFIWRTLHGYFNCRLYMDHYSSNYSTTFYIIFNYVKQLERISVRSLPS